MGRNFYSPVSSSLVLGMVLFASASASADDCQNREMFIPSSYYEAGNRDAFATDVHSYVSDSAVPETDEGGDDGLVRLSVPSIPKKLTKNFHFLGKKKYETNIRPEFFA